MSFQQILHQFIEGMRQTSLLEYVAVVFGITSVYFSRIESIWLYPTGLVNTIIYIWLSIKGHLFGEASVNLYYTVVSIYGWALWSKRDAQQQHTLRITRSSARFWAVQLLFFMGCYGLIYAALHWLKQSFAPEAIPWADAFASATAYTGMWLMARKKVESWYWWIATDIASIPLYFVKGYVFTSVQYLVMLGIAISGLVEWNRKSSAAQ